MFRVLPLGLECWYYVVIYYPHAIAQFAINLRTCNLVWNRYAAWNDLRLFTRTAPEPDVYLQFTFFKMTLQLPRRRAKYGAPRPGGARWAAHRRAGRRASTAVRPTAGGAAPQESGRRSSRLRQAGATGTRRGRGQVQGSRSGLHRVRVRGFGFGLEGSGSGVEGSGSG